MGIMDMFKLASTVAPAPAPTQPLPGNIPSTAATTGTSSPGTAGNGAIPTPATPATPAIPENPLDKFTDLWKANPPAGPDASADYFNVNLEALNKAAASQSFTGSLTPENLAAVAAGGENAVKAFQAAMETVARDTYARSALATTRIVETALKKADTRFQEKLPTYIKQHTLSDSLRTENPAFSHPAAQPVIQALEAQMTQKFPNATATELRTMANQYLSQLATVFTAPATATAAAAVKEKEKAADTDWTTFLG